MGYPDLINGAFEAAGGLSMLANVRRILRDKLVRGVDLKATALFTSWGFWNLWYYPALGQWVSFSGGLVIVLGNAVWLALAVKYRTKEG